MAFSLNPLGRKIRDIFDANTAEDQRKRLTAGQPRYYQDQKAGQYYNFGTQSRTNVNPNQNPGTVNATYKNVDPSIRNTILTSKYLTQDQKINKLNSLNTPTKPFSATNALLSTWGDMGKGLVNAVTESPTQLGRSAAFGFSQDVKDAQQSANWAQEANLSNIQTARNALQNPYLTADQRQRYLNLYQKALNNIGETNYAAQSLARERVSETDPRKVLAAAADTAFTAATAGVGTAGYKGLQTALKAGTKQGLKELAGQSTKLAGLAAPSGFAGTYVVNPDATLNEALKNTAITGLVGAALPIAGGAIGDVAAKGTRAAVKTASKINLSTPHIAALKEQNIALQKAFEKTSDIRTRTAAAQQIALNNQEINRITQGGYISTGNNKVTTKSKKSNVAQSDAEYRAQQAAREKLYSQSPIQKARNATGNALWDPRNIEQRLDNAEFKRLKQAGKIKKGQSELLLDQSLAVQRGRIQNPNRAAEVRNKQKFGTGKDKYSINDIIKHYGKENSPKARDFENYRIYKDQLERLANGEKNTIGIDEKAMSTFVNRYEKSNPLAVKHNAALRQATLQALAEKNKMRIDNPELLKIAEKYKFYNPRKAIDPEDLVRPKMSGGVRSGAKTTKGRSETSGGPVRSPLSTFREMNTELERSLAEQRYGQEFRRRTAAGTIKGARETVNAETVIKHKKLLKDMESLRAQKDDLKRVRDQLKKDAKSGEQAAYKTSVQAKKAEDRVVDMTRNLLEKARETGTKRPVYTRKQLLDLSKTLSDENLAAKVEKSAAQKAKLTSFEKNVEDLKSMLRQARDDIKNLDEASRKKWGETIQTVQRTERGTQEITYKLDGETGRIEIPPELAKSLDEQTKMMNRTIVERGLRGVANVQKLTWTGALQPAFKAWNVMVKNPILQFINADGLSGVRPETMSAFIRQVVNTKKMAQFKKDMLSRNMAYENALQSTNIFSTAADDIAARANIVTFFKRNPAKTLQDVWKGINQGLAAADNAQRYSVAYGAYKRAKGLGFSEKQALDIASQAPGKVFGDFDRVTRLAQDMEALVPYTGATQAGTRALGRAFKTKPITTGAKAAAVVGGMTALTAYSISNAKEYYKDMIDSGKEYVIDNNWVIALPGASRNKDGNWSGIISVPMLPDIRPANRATWKTVYDQTEGNGIDGKMVASEMFNQMTGDVANQLYDVERTDNRKNLVNGVLPGSPIANVSKTLSGVNTFTGNPLADEFTASRPRVEQKNKNTSPGAEKISKSINGVLTPLQVDQLLGQIGTTGDVVQGKDDTRGTIVQSFTKPLQPGKGLSDKSRSGKQYYEAVDSAGQTIKNADDFRVFQSLTSKNSEKTAFDSAARAKELLARPSVLQALAQVNKETGSKDPFYNLTNQQQQKVLLYRSSKDLNSAKQAYDKDGNPLFTSLGLDEKWYSDYKDKEDAFYKSISGGESGTITTFSGAVKPKASDELQALIDAYYTIPKGTGARSSYLKQHPEILAYWDKSNQFTNAERIALGLDVNTTDSTGSGSYSSGGSSGSSFANARKYAISLNAGGTPSSSSGVKASQVKWKGSGVSVNKPKVTIKKSKV